MSWRATLSCSRTLRIFSSVHLMNNSYTHIFIYLFFTYARTRLRRTSKTEWLYCGQIREVVTRTSNFIIHRVPFELTKLLKTSGSTKHQQCNTHIKLLPIIIRHPSNAPKLYIMLFYVIIILYNHILFSSNTRGIIHYCTGCEASIMNKKTISVPRTDSLQRVSV